MYKQSFYLLLLVIFGCSSYQISKDQITLHDNKYLVVEKIGEQKVKVANHIMSFERFSRNARDIARQVGVNHILLGGDTQFEVADILILGAYLRTSGLKLSFKGGGDIRPVLLH